MVAAVATAGGLLAFMSIIDTLAYAVRTAGVKTKKLAISISLFNMLTIFARMSNLIQAPILGNLCDKVRQGVYTADEVLAGLRLVLLFIAGGVILGALLTPSFIRLASRGIEVMERKGSLFPTVAYALRRIWRLPVHMSLPSLSRIKPFLNVKNIPYNFLVFNVFVTCFYSIGVMSTLMAASWSPDRGVTNVSLSGIVNGIATMFFFAVVDPPAAVLVDQCIHGKRPFGHVVTMNIYLIVTRLIGVLLGWVLLPYMAQYVLWAAKLVDTIF
jgi:hypothetical protein